MMTNEQAEQHKAALEEEKLGYERRLARAESAGDDEQATDLKKRIKNVDKAIRGLDSQVGTLIDGSVDDVLGRVGDDPELAYQALNLESDQKKPRKSLIEGLRAITQPEDE